MKLGNNIYSRFRDLKLSPRIMNDVAQKVDSRLSLADLTFIELEIAIFIRIQPFALYVFR